MKLIFASFYFHLIAINEELSQCITVFSAKKINFNKKANLSYNTANFSTWPKQDWDKSLPILENASDSCFLDNLHALSLLKSSEFINFTICFEQIDQTEILVFMKNFVIEKSRICLISILRMKIRFANQTKKGQKMIEAYSIIFPRSKKKKSFQ